MARDRSTATWRIPAGLVALSAIPLVSGTLRLVELAGGPVTLPAKEALLESPAAVVVHITAAIPFVLLGALQLSAGARGRWPAWHRRTGRLLVPLGAAAAASALWMNQFYVEPGGRNELLYLVRLGFGSLMLWSLVLGVQAVRRRDFRAHQAWMTRAYAVGLGAGTQAFTLGVGQGVFGTTDLTTAVFQAAGWAINLAVAEWAIRRSPHIRSRTEKHRDNHVPAAR